MAAKITNETYERKEITSEFKTLRVKVYRLNTEPENRDNPIVCHIVGVAKKVFYPGQEVKLPEPMVTLLRTTVEENEIPIPRDSAIYESDNPKATAERQWPGFVAQLDQVTGDIIMIKRIPCYAVEVLGG